MTHTYEVVGCGVDYTGWFKIWLRRDDGKEVKVSRRRAANLRREGRLFNLKDGLPWGDWRYLPATCGEKP